MDWNWETMRAHYVRLLQAAIDRGLKQEDIAAAGGLTPKKQNYISKIKHTRMEYGPATEIFIRLIAGLGMPVSDFFAELEGRALPARTLPGGGASAAPPSAERPIHEPPDTRAIVNAVIETLQRGVAAPARTPRPRRRKKRG